MLKFLNSKHFLKGHKSSLLSTHIFNGFSSYFMTMMSFHKVKINLQDIVCSARYKQALKRFVTSKFMTYSTKKAPRSARDFVFDTKVQNDLIPTKNLNFKIKLYNSTIYYITSFSLYIYSFRSIFVNPFIPSYIRGVDLLHFFVAVLHILFLSLPFFLPLFVYN